MNQEIIDIFKQYIYLLNVSAAKKETAFKINAYQKAIRILESLPQDVAVIYKEKGLKGIQELGIGPKNAKKIEEYLKKGKIKDFQEMQDETAIRQIITHFFESKGLGLQELKENAKKRKIIYSRFTKPAKQLLELAGSIEASKQAIDKVAAWAGD